MSGEEFEDERSMRRWVAENLELIEPGLHLHGCDEDTEFAMQTDLDALPVGWIDILAVDRRGDYVVVECKNTKAHTAALGQLVAYIAWVRAWAPAPSGVRGVLVVRQASSRLVMAASYLSGERIEVIECPGRGVLRRVV